MGVGQMFPERLFTLSGDPVAINGSAADWSRFAGLTSATAGDLRSLDPGEFVGDEADLYRAQVNSQLPPYLDTASQAWTIVAHALIAYGDRLATLQARMRSLRSDGYAALQCAATAQPAAAGPAGTTPTADRRPDPAAERAEATFDDFIADAGRVHAENRQAVDDCVGQIDQAKTMRFADPPGWLEAAWDDMCDWVSEHVDVLQALSSILKQISSVAGMLAMIPFLAPLAGPIALGTGMLATGIDAGIKLTTGQGDWSQIALGGVALIPGARAATAVAVVDTGLTAYNVATGKADWADLAMTVGLNTMGANTKHGSENAKGPSRVHDAGPDLMPNSKQRKTVDLGSSAGDAQLRHLQDAFPVSTYLPAGQRCTTLRRQPPSGQTSRP